MIERAQRIPDVETLVQIATALNITLSQLFIEAHEPTETTSRSLRTLELCVLTGRIWTLCSGSRKSCSKAPAVPLISRFHALR